VVIGLLVLVAVLALAILISRRRRSQLAPLLVDAHDMYIASVPPVIDSGPRVPPIVVIGSPCVGKTSLVNRLTQGKFTSITAPTTGTAIHLYHASGEVPELQLWDTPGMDRYRRETTEFYTEAVGAILVFDLSSFTSFQELDSWLDEFMASSRPNPAIVICGNKADLQDSREVEDDEIVAFCNSHNNLPYFEVSACTGDGLTQMMHSIAELIPPEAPIETSAATLSEPQSQASERRCW
jgi:small GTP-binding protein